MAFFITVNERVYTKCVYYENESVECEFTNEFNGFTFLQDGMPLLLLLRGGIDSLRHTFLGTHNFSRVDKNAPRS